MPSPIPAAALQHAELQANCPVRDVLDHVAAKWTTLILIALEPRPLRFGELRRALPDISKRMRTQSLRDLERDGLLTRQGLPDQARAWSTACPGWDARCWPRSAR